MGERRPKDRVNLQISLLTEDFSLEFELAITHKVKPPPPPAACWFSLLEEGKTAEPNQFWMIIKNRNTLGYHAGSQEIKKPVLIENLLVQNIGFF